METFWEGSFGVVQFELDAWREIGGELVWRDVEACERGRRECRLRCETLYEGGRASRNISYVERSFCAGWT